MRGGADEQVVTPGNAWTIDAPTSGDTPVTVADPDGHPVEAQVVSSGRTTRLALANPHLPGAYAVKQSDRLIASAVVNVDARESDTRPMALENLKSGAGATATVVRDEGDLLLAGKNRALWPLLAAAAAAFFALEMLLLALWRRRTGLPGAATKVNFRSPGPSEFRESENRPAESALHASPSAMDRP